MPKSKNSNASFLVIFKHCVTVAIAKWMIVRSRVPLPFDKRSRENSFLKDSREACTPKIVTLHTTEEVRSDFCTRPFTTQRNASSTQGHILFFFDCRNSTLISFLFLLSLIRDGSTTSSLILQHKSLSQF